MKIPPKRGLVCWRRKHPRSGSCQMAMIPMIVLMLLLSFLEVSPPVRRVVAGALGLGSLGVYGVVGYAVGQRTREVGVRLALGGSISSVIAKLLRQALVPVALGLVLGVGAAVSLSGLLVSTTFGGSCTSTGAARSTRPPPPR